MDSSHTYPSKILIVRAGVLGLSTARALLQRPQYSNTTITILDAAPELPNASSASADTSRILRADYALKPYTTLVSEGQKLWKDLSDDGTDGHVDSYLEESFEIVENLAKSSDYVFKASHLRELHNKEAIKQETRFPGLSGDFGYANDNCGWVNAEACVKFVFKHLQETGEEFGTLDI